MRKIVIALLLISSVFVGVYRGRAACGSQYGAGHDASCWDLGSCGPTYWTYCTVTTCYADGDELWRGCYPGVSQGCTFGSCLGVALNPWSGCGGCP